MTETKMRVFLPVLILLVASNLCVQADNATEIAENKVEIKFYRLQVSEWDSGLMESKFHALLASETNTYCGSNLAACGLVGLQSEFKDSHIGKVDNSPLNDDKDMLYEFYIMYPENSNKSSSSVLTYVLSESVVKTIILQLRTNTDYISSLGCDKCYITYIGSDFYGIPPSALENKIIIPLAFLVLLIVIIIAISLTLWDKRREKEARFQKMHKPKPKGPQYPTKPAPPKTTELPDEKVAEKKPSAHGVVLKPHRKEKMYEGSGTTPKKAFDRSGGASNDSGLDVDTLDSRTNSKPYSLQPLAQGDQETERKKRKKEKKKRSRKSKVDGAENQGYMAEDEGLEKVEMKTEL
ncbi:Hypothetical predicted protein [Mytilus galloprovincialis]|uniref:Uncharacterized protein n=1 Tax=Mytilus galloprovincialis TaxID=29158 RepID=A0A8B6HJQ0_MYTGA|nr:Hypothetical predicted protein [Mytilus galloprovincialis]